MPDGFAEAMDGEGNILRKEGDKIIKTGNIFKTSMGWEDNMEAYIFNANFDNESSFADFYDEF